MTGNLDKTKKEVGGESSVPVEMFTESEFRQLLLSESGVRRLSEYLKRQKKELEHIYKEAGYSDKELKELNAQGVIENYRNVKEKLNSLTKFISNSLQAVSANVSYDPSILNSAATQFLDFEKSYRDLGVLNVYLPSVREDIKKLGKEEKKDSSESEEEFATKFSLDSTKRWGEEAREGNPLIAEAKEYAENARTLRELQEANEKRRKEQQAEVDAVGASVATEVPRGEEGKFPDDRVGIDRDGAEDVSPISQKTDSDSGSPKADNEAGATISPEPSTEYPTEEKSSDVPPEPEAEPLSREEFIQMAEEKISEYERLLLGTFVALDSSKKKILEGLVSKARLSLEHLKRYHKEYKELKDDNKSLRSHITSSIGQIENYLDFIQRYSGRDDLKSSTGSTADGKRSGRAKKKSEEPPVDTEEYERAREEFRRAQEKSIHLKSEWRRIKKEYDEALFRYYQENRRTQKEHKKQSFWENEGFEKPDSLVELERRYLDVRQRHIKAVTHQSEIWAKIRPFDATDTDKERRAARMRAAVVQRYVVDVTRTKIDLKKQALQRERAELTKKVLSRAGKVMEVLSRPKVKWGIRIGIFVGATVFTGGAAALVASGAGAGVLAAGAIGATAGATAGGARGLATVSGIGGALGGGLIMNRGWDVIATRRRRNEESSTRRTAQENVANADFSADMLSAMEADYEKAYTTLQKSERNKKIATATGAIGGGVLGGTLGYDAYTQITGGGVPQTPAMPPGSEVTPEPEPFAPVEQPPSEVSPVEPAPVFPPSEIMPGTPEPEPVSPAEPVQPPIMKPNEPVVLPPEEVNPAMPPGSAEVTPEPVEPPVLKPEEPLVIPPEETLVEPGEVVPENPENRIYVVQDADTKGLWNIMEGSGSDEHPVGGQSEVVKEMSRTERNHALDTLFDYMRDHQDFAEKVGITDPTNPELIVHAKDSIKVGLMDAKILELLGQENINSAVGPEGAVDIPNPQPRPEISVGTPVESNADPMVTKESVNGQPTYTPDGKRIMGEDIFKESVGGAETSAGAVAPEQPTTIESAEAILGAPRFGLSEEVMEKIGKEDPTEIYNAWNRATNMPGSLQSSGLDALKEYDITDPSQLDGFAKWMESIATDTEEFRGDMRGSLTVSEFVEKYGGVSTEVPEVSPTQTGDIEEVAGGIIDRSDPDSPRIEGVDGDVTVEYGANSDAPKVTIEPNSNAVDEALAEHFREQGGIVERFVPEGDSPSLEVTNNNVPASSSITETVEKYINAIEKPVGFFGSMFGFGGENIVGTYDVLKDLAMQNIVDLQQHAPQLEQFLQEHGLSSDAFGKHFNEIQKMDDVLPAKPNETYQDYVTRYAASQVSNDNVGGSMSRAA